MQDFAECMLYLKTTLIIFLGTKSAIGIKLGNRYFNMVSSYFCLLEVWCCLVGFDDGMMMR